MADKEKNTVSTDMVVKESSEIAKNAADVSGKYADNDYSNFQGINVNTRSKYNRFGLKRRKKKKMTEIPEMDPEILKRRTNITLIVVGLLIVLFIFYVISAYRKDAGITKSTHSRKVLKTESVDFTELDVMYNDAAAESAGDYLAYLSEGLETFYDQTGVQPYLYLTSEEDRADSEAALELFAQDLMDSKEIIKDSAHMLVVYQDNNPDAEIAASDEDYYVSVIVGEDAASTLDEEAVNIFLDYLDKYYYGTDYDSQTIFYGTFTAASSRIMGGSTLTTTLILCIVVALLIVTFVVRYRVLSGKYDKDPTEPDTRTPAQIAKAEKREQWMKRFFG